MEKYATIRKISNASLALLISASHVGTTMDQFERKNQMPVSNTNSQLMQNKKYITPDWATEENEGGNADNSMQFNTSSKQKAPEKPVKYNLIKTPTYPMTQINRSSISSSKKPEHKEIHNPRLGY